DGRRWAASAGRTGSRPGTWQERTLLPRTRPLRASEPTRPGELRLPASSPRTSAAPAPSAVPTRVLAVGSSRQPSGRRRGRGRGGRRLGDVVLVELVLVEDADEQVRVVRVGSVRGKRRR